jgi:5-methyltetrahydrofolate--homocysteine methyltransferase
MDVIGLSLVTMGAKASLETQRLFEAGEYTQYLYLHGLSVETAEALAEYLHKKMRQELGIAGEDSPHIRDSLPPEISWVAIFIWLSGGSESGRSDHTVCFAQAGRERRGAAHHRVLAGQSTSAIVVHHPGAKYFVV